MKEFEILPMNISDLLKGVDTVDVSEIIEPNLAFPNINKCPYFGEYFVYSKELNLLGCLCPLHKDETQKIFNEKS